MKTKVMKQVCSFQDAHEYYIQLVNSLGEISNRSDLCNNISYLDYYIGDYKTITLSEGVHKRRN